MNEERKKIIEKIHNTEIKDLQDEVPKKSKWGVFKEVVKELILWRFRFLGGLLGVSEEDISSRSVGRTQHCHHHTSSNSQGSSFRESHKFDPSRAYMQRIQETAYLKMIDGKGDPEPCDCDHDR